VTDLQHALLYAAIIIGSLSAGYGARRGGLLGERLAKVLMAVITVAGYPIIQAVAIWRMDLRIEHAWMPSLGAVTALIMAFVAIGVSRRITAVPRRRGLLVVHSCMFNTGVTMGGLVLLGLYGADKGLGLMGIYSLMWAPFVVLVTYPIARHYSPTHAGGSLGGLMIRSVFDWRSVGLPLVIASVFVSAYRVPCPPQIGQWHVPAILAYSTVVLGFFSIGLRLHFSHTKQLLGLIGALAVLRFVVAGVVAVGLMLATRWTPWPLAGIEGRAFVIEAIMPTAVTSVGIASLFDLDADEAATIFVINTLSFLVLIMPVIFVVCG